MSASRSWRYAVAAAQLLAGAVGAYHGFAFGTQLGGFWLGLVAAANTGALAAVFAGSALAQLGTRRPG